MKTTTVDNQLNFKIRGIRKPKPAKEYLLHREIIARCKANNWICFYSKMWRKTGRPPGEPDFSIYGNHIHFMIEAKREGEEMNEIQNKVSFQLAMKGHLVYQARTIEDLNIIFNTEKGKEL